MVKLLPEVVLVAIPCVVMFALLLGSTIELLAGPDVKVLPDTERFGVTFAEEVPEVNEPVV